ncbi:MAG: hypothetical protein BGO31_14855 [Bacteroidetes bacterium 43-16]|nr:MAG: hypothetical protein BGO31_14855 [Bacteroidetes bacterium 43-16]
MKHILLLFLFIYTFSCTGNSNTSGKIPGSTANIIPEAFSTFEHMLSRLDTYSRDSFDVPDFSAEGGEMIVYHVNSGNRIIQIVLYGETGKIRYRYLTDQHFHHKLTEITQYHYDRPFYEEEMKMDSTAHYLSYFPATKLFDSKKTEIKEDKTIKQLTENAETLLKDILVQIDFYKQ